MAHYNLNTPLSEDDVRQLKVRDTVTVKATVEDVVQKKGRAVVSIKGEAYNPDGQKAAVSTITVIWPPQS